MIEAKAKPKSKAMPAYKPRCGGIILAGGVVASGWFNAEASGSGIKVDKTEVLMGKEDIATIDLRETCFYELA